jgi:hypothetical protein
MKKRILLTSCLSLPLVFSNCKKAPDTESNPQESSAKSGPVGESELKGLAQVRDSFLAVKSKAEFEDFLVKLDGNKDAGLEVKYFSAMAQLIRPFKGIIYKLTPIVSQNKATHSFFLTLVQNAISSTGIYLPSAHWQAVIAFLTEPDASIGAQYRTLSDAQAETEAVLLPALTKAIAAIEALNVSDSDPIVWDNRFFHGNASFADPRDRFTKIGVAEKFSVLASLNYAVSAAKAACAYNLDDLPRVVSALGKIIGVDGFMGDRITGSPIMERASVVKRFSSFMTLNQKGAALMGSALSDFAKGVDYASQSFSAVASRNSALGGARDEYWNIRPDRLMPEQRSIQLTLQELKAMATGPTSLYSGVTNEKTTVNLAAFFKNPPTDLKSFFPTAFVTATTESVGGITINNYLYGSGTAWNPGAYSQYLSGVSSPTDVPRIARLLSQSWGGRFIWAGLAGFVN